MQLQTITIQPVDDIATYLLILARKDFTALAPMTHLKLQKLLYYAQGYSLALHQQPLFAEPIAAWRLGPVVPSLYQHYRRYHDAPLPLPPESALPDLPAIVKDLLNQVYATYGPHGARELSERTHTEDPWLQTPQSAIIQLQFLQEFFTRQLQTIAEQYTETTTNEASGFTPDEAEHLAAVTLASEALEGFTHEPAAVLEAYVAAHRRPPVDLW